MSNCAITHYGALVCSESGSGGFCSSSLRSSADTYMVETLTSANATIIRFISRVPLCHEQEKGFFSIGYIRY